MARRNPARDRVTLDVAITVPRGELELAVEMVVRSGEVVAVLGPNGAGKSTLLRCLAGLLPIASGHISLDGTDLDVPGRDVFVPPERRAVSVVFQDYLLFAHLSALENVAFGLRAQGTPARAARAAAMAWLDTVGLADRAGARPAQLSGGQSQRVALARAMATRPRLLLLDEPLAALDATTRSSLRRELRQRLAEVDGARVLVTHDPVDAYALADRMIVLEQGRIVQSGTLADVTAHPRSRYVADLVGINLVRGKLSGGRLETDSGAIVVSAAHEVADGPAFAAIRPGAVALHVAAPAGSPRNVWATTVHDIDLRGDRVRVILAGAIPLVAEVTPDGLAGLALRPGDAVYASVKATEVTVYAS
jgi:molybdate transport system ATP-binding protein